MTSPLNNLAILPGHVQVCERPVFVCDPCGCGWQPDHVSSSMSDTLNRSHSPRTGLSTIPGIKRVFFLNTFCSYYVFIKRLSTPIHTKYELDKCFQNNVFKCLFGKLKHPLGLLGGNILTKSKELICIRIVLIRLTK